MNIVTDRSAVFRVVVVTEDREVRTTTNGDLREKGEEIVGDSKRVFSECAGDVGSGGVEVAEGGGFPGRVCGAEVFYEVFAGDFCAAVGVRWTTGTDFCSN